MAHVLVAGMTLSGKTNMAKLLARDFQRRGYQIAVLDVLNDPEWCADFQTRDPAEFLECVKQSRQLGLFIDESGESIGRYNDEMFWLATRARHYGHKSVFISQRPSQLSRTVWTQCTDLFLFNISEYDAKMLAIEWNQPVLKEAGTLGKYECIHARKMGGVRRLKVPPVPPCQKSLDTDSEGGAIYEPDRNRMGSDRGGGNPAGREPETQGDGQ